MATDLKVQFFSSSNGLNLTNNVGDLIALLDTCLVNGKSLPTVTAATIDGSGNITLTFGTAHSTLAFQIVELSGFVHASLNGKYRVNSVPDTTHLVLQGSASLIGLTATTLGTAKLSPLGYQIVYTGTLKRVYRALSPTASHPYIRIDETYDDGAGNVWTTTYSKFAMVGLIENMTGIDDYTDVTKLQCPLLTSDFTRNFKISGTGTSAIRGYGRWMWARSTRPTISSADTATPTAGNRLFTLCGDQDAFYLIVDVQASSNKKVLSGAGLFDACLDSSVIPNWFNMCFLYAQPASNSYASYQWQTGSPLVISSYTGTSYFSVPKYAISSRLSDSALALPLFPIPATSTLANSTSGQTNIYSASNVPAIDISFSDSDGYLRGTLKHVKYCGKILSLSSSTTYLADKSMYVADSIGLANDGIGAVYFYLGELQ